MDVGRPSKKNPNAIDPQKQKLLENLLDKGPTVRTSLVFSAEQHRLYKMYLAKNGKTIKDDLLAHVDECIRSLDD